MALNNHVEKFTLDMAPGGIAPVLNMSQGDNGRVFVADMYWSGTSYDVSGLTVRLRGRKRDNTVFDYALTAPSGSEVTIDTKDKEQIAIIPGNVECELVFTDSNSRVVGTADFVIIVEESPYDPNAISESEVTGLVDLISDQIGGAVDEWMETEAPTSPEFAASVQSATDAYLDENGVQFTRGTNGVVRLGSTAATGTAATITGLSVHDDGGNFDGVSKVDFHGVDGMFSETVTPTIIQGSYSNTGAVTTNSARLRTKGFSKVCAGDVIHFEKGTNVTKIIVGSFTMAGAFISETAWFSENTDITATQDSYIICAFENDGGTDITPADFDATVTINRNGLVDDTLSNYGKAADAEFTGRFKLTADTGKNICNPYDEKWTHENTYVAYNNGYLRTLANWVSILMPVEGGRNISTRSTEGAHITFYSKYVPFFSILPVNKQISGYISGVTGALTNYTVPNNAKYMVVSVPVSRKATIQVEYGAAATSYEPYKQGLNVDKVLGLEIPSEPETIEYNIKADGSGDFANLKACFDSITDGSPTKKYIVNLYPGVYDVASLYTDHANERGLFLPNYTTLRGVGDKHNVIIKAELATGSTNFSAMNFRDICEVENLTITSKNCRYTIHDDWQTTTDAENYRHVKNVIFVGDHSQYGSVYGSGLHGNATWIFENCEFDATTAAPGGNGGNAFSNHNTVNSSKPSFIKFVNCRLTNGTINYKTLRLMSMNNNSENGTVTVTLEGCKVDGIYLGENYPDQYGQGIKYWVNGFGNVNSKGVDVVSTDGVDYSGNVDLI